MKENYLAKWLNNELSEAELAAFKETAEYASYQRIIEASARMEGPAYDPAAAYNDLKAKLTDRNSENKKAGKVIQMRPLRKLMAIAAAIVLMIAVSFWFVNSQDETVSTLYAQSTTHTLPDASEIILNAGSEITYSKKKWNKERVVSLEGEAFFKVAKGEKFSVDTDLGEVWVLGTQFNVEQRGDYFEVTCYEGLVRVNFARVEKELPAGSSFLAINGKVIPVEGPNADVPSWLNQESSFKSIPLKYVLEEFERQFDIEVETRGVDLNQLFTGTFSNTNKELALQSISSPSRLTYDLDGENVIFYAEETP
ncbi:FecR domain-containing protein [Zeaxanthinibacter sp. PT1]|uniref:FecR family protein n=1 Tax=Zeaxanthinibacter TaxID=561554 RepID=UPI00234A5E53|nr:FecR domain-containing protein [Zeaxanthinibacter sp. PT1]MDC6352590.1 FecR domain-containing protein [Zeaxanthinibacter sp. PT1]